MTLRYKYVWRFTFIYIFVTSVLASFSSVLTFVRSVSNSFSYVFEIVAYFLHIWFNLYFVICFPPAIYITDVTSKLATDTLHLRVNAMSALTARCLSTHPLIISFSVHNLLFGDMLTYSTSLPFWITYICRPLIRHLPCYSGPEAVDSPRLLMLTLTGRTSRCSGSFGNSGWFLPQIASGSHCLWRVNDD